MEEKLKRLFDYQRFSGNDRLEAMLKETQTRYPANLSEEDLLRVNAAGVPGDGGEPPKPIAAPRRNWIRK